MLGTQIKADGIYSLEIPLVNETLKYSLGNVPFLKDKIILGIVNDYKADKLLPSGNSMVPIQVSTGWLLNIVTINRENVIVNMPLAITREMFNKGFLINDKVNLQDSFIDISTGGRNASPGANKSIVLNFYYLNKPSKDIVKKYGFVYEIYSEIQPVGYWQSLNMLKKLDSTYKAVSLCISEPDKVFLNLKNTEGRLVYDKVAANGLCSVVLDSTFQTTITEFEIFKPTNFDFTSSEIYYTAAASYVSKGIGLIFVK